MLSYNSTEICFKTIDTEFLPSEKANKSKTEDQASK